MERIPAPNLLFGKYMKKNKPTKPIREKVSGPRDKNKSTFRAEMEDRGFYGNQVKMAKQRKKELIQEFLDAQLADLDNPNTRDLSVHTFFLKRGYRLNQVLKWLEKDPELKHMYTMGKEAIGVKRETGMLKKELSEKATMYTMHKYLDEWREADKYQSELKNITDAVAALLGKEFEVPDLEGKE